MAFGYPVFLELTGAPVLVVGGGAIAARKAAGLAAAGARVTVIAPDVVDGIAAAHVERRAYESGDVAGFRLVFTATDDPAVNAQVARDATAAGIWVNSADDPENCSFILPAIARRGPLTVAVSTGGSTPAFAARLRDEIAASHLSDDAVATAAALAAERAALHAEGRSTEHVDWAERIDSARGRHESGRRGEPPAR
jgi:siroheme synthase-like protein